MAYAAKAVSGSIKDATVRDLIAANEFMKMLKSKDVVLSFPKLMTYPTWQTMGGIS